MTRLQTTFNNLTLSNPFVIASGPPGTNGEMIKKAIEEGWGAVIAKTVSLTSEHVKNLIPRYAKLRGHDSNEIIGWENVELISDRPFKTWLQEFREIKDSYPDSVLIASVMEEFSKDRWIEIVERCQETGVDAIELNLSCPHGHSEHRMGAAIGENPDLIREVCGWAASVAKIPIIAKLTPNVTRIEPCAEAAFASDCAGVSAINTIRSVMGINLNTLRPEPTINGYSTHGGYSGIAVRPIALRICMEIAKLRDAGFPSKSLSGVGGVETGRDAAQFLLLGCDSVQVCTGIMKKGFRMVKSMQKDLLDFMDQHKFNSIADFKGHSLNYFKTHTELLKLQQASKTPNKVVQNDRDWNADEVVSQSSDLSSDKA